MKVNGNGSYIVINAMGLQLFEAGIQLPGQVDLSAYSSGIYFINIEMEGQRWFKKLIKE
jgi:hypothetical protein